MKTLILDGHNLLFKAYGIPFKYYSKKGMPLHVVTTYLGFIRRSIEAASLEEGEELIVVFDTPSPTSNHALSTEYKANRISDFSQLDVSPIHHLPL